MPLVDNLDFLNLNSIRNYPIKDGQSRVSTDGVFTIPNDFIVDAQLAASYDPTRRFYISKVSNLGDGVIVEIADHLNQSVGTFTCAFSGQSTYKEYYLVASSYYVGATGVISVASIDSIASLPTGVFLFDITATEFEARAVIPALKGINRLIFENADGSTISLTGDVEILARSNLKFKKEVGVNRVIVDAGDNLGLNKICEPTLPCIRTINGIPPDENGDFTIDFSDCATLTPIPAGTGLILQDICCKPCMGCNDIEELTNRLTQTESSLLSLRDYYAALENLFNNYKITTEYDCNC